jgi:hypothetical protein
MSETGIKLLDMLLIPHRWAFAQMGYGPGVALYTVFGVLAL